MLTNSGNTITNVKAGYYYALYVTGGTNIYIDNADIISGPASGGMSGVYIIKANASSITFHNQYDFYNRACELEGEIIAGA